MSLPDRAASLQVCALRVSRLAADGTTPASASGAYVSDRLMSLAINPDMEKGVELTVRSACGDVPVRWQQPEVFKRVDLSLSLLTPDPELIELLHQTTLVTGPYNPHYVDGAMTAAAATLTSATAAFVAGDVGKAITVRGAGTAGADLVTTISAFTNATTVTLAAAAVTTVTNAYFTITARTGNLGNQYPVAGSVTGGMGACVEAWTRAIPSGLQDVDLPWWRWVLPYTKWRPGNVNLDGSHHEIPNTGFGEENPNIGNGPWNDWPPVVTANPRAAQRFRDSAIPTVAAGYTTIPAQV